MKTSFDGKTPLKLIEMTRKIIDSGATKSDARLLIIRGLSRGEVLMGRWWIFLTGFVGYILS